jgi:WXXGXW repeat (2 copies)
MTRTLSLALALALVLPTTAAFAGRGRGRGGHGAHNRANGGVVVTQRGRPARGNYVRVSNNRYVFPGGVVRTYKRPKHRRYVNVNVRPAIIVEAYDPVPGYVWVQGNWTWGGAEWVWQPGYWQVAAYEPPPPQPVVSGGISISGGITIR